MLPLHRRQWPATHADNAEIAAAIRARAHAPYLLGGSLRGGAYARRAFDLLAWPEPAVATLRGRVYAMLADHAGDDEWHLTGWGNMNRHGDSNAPHRHELAEGHWTLIYYVDAGDGPPSRTLFYAAPDAPPALAVEPAPGLMLLFPGWVWHSVEPYYGTGERITVAVNAAPAASPRRAAA